MNELRLKIALAYKVPRITKFIDDDTKLIKRLNNILNRFEKNKNDRYILECINILRQLDNVFDNNKLYPVLCELLDIKFHSTLLFLCEKLDNPFYLNKKLQEIIEDNEDYE